MSNETKREVLEDVLSDLMNQFYFLNVDEKIAKGTCSDYVSRYCAALPDDLPVIPESISEYIKISQTVTHNDLADVFETIRNIGNPTGVLGWIFANQNTFARAWVLGVWRVKETFEIVKLEENE